MNKYLVLLLIGQATLSLGAGLTMKDVDCQIFIGKFGELEKNGVATKISFNGEASFLPNSANLQVKLRYSDAEYYDNPNYFGLTKEDGLDDKKTCLDLKMFKYTSDKYSEADKSEITTLDITHASNDQQKQRYLLFTITEDQFKTFLQQTESTASYVYIGYFSLAYYIGDNLQNSLFFSFSATINKASGAGVITSFQPISSAERVNCNPNCSVTPSSSLQFCNMTLSDPCSEFVTTPNIYLDDQFYVVQTITTAGLTNFYLSDAQIQYIGNGLNKVATQVGQADYSKPGQAKFLLKATIAWNSLQIRSVATLVTRSQTRLLLKEAIQTSYAESDTICMRAKDGTGCPNCTDMTSSNQDGEAPSECYQEMIKFIMVILVLIC